MGSIPSQKDSDGINQFLRKMRAEEQAHDKADDISAKIKS